MPPFSVTTPIYYVNDVPHIGHAYTTIAGDVLARWRRLWGDEVFFLTGTDEHGLKMAQAAEAQGLTPKDWADRTSERFREAWKELRISNDDFIRTTEPRHYAAVQEMLQKVYDNGDIELSTYEGLYCVACEAYYTEDELVDGNCPIHGRPVTRMQEENYFFKLSRYEQRLLEHYEAHPDAVQPETRRNEVLGFIRQGLQDFSISRTSISWGIPIPWNPKHVAYVWFDALINYCTAMGYGSDRERFDHFWPVDYHLVGKDILRFHAVYWPAILLSAGLPVPDVILAHGFVTADGRKISKSLGNTVDPYSLVDEFGVDAVRHFLLRHIRTTEDGDFTRERLLRARDADLADQLGNLVSRVVSMVARYLAGVVPAVESPARDLAREVDEALARFETHDALAAIWRVVEDANRSVVRTKPWELARDADPRLPSVLGSLCASIRLVGAELEPFLPRTGAEILARVPAPGGSVIAGDPLFPKS